LRRQPLPSRSLRPPSRSCDHLLCHECAGKAFRAGSSPKCPVCGSGTSNAVLQIPVMPPSPALDDAAWFYILTRPTMAMKLLQASVRFHR